MLGDDVGAAFSAIHRAHGVELRGEDQIVGFEGSERVEAAVTANGVRVACDFVVVGVGIEPEIPTFVGQPVETSNGVLVDELCRSSAPEVYAAGDVANHLHPVFGRVRVEHYNNGEQMGRAAARSMLGSTAPYDYIHSFWSDHTSTSWSTSATPRSGTSSSSAGAWRSGSWSGSIWSKGSYGPPWASTAEVTLSWTPTRRWRRAHGSWARVLDPLPLSSRMKT